MQTHITNITVLQSHWTLAARRMRVDKIHCYLFVRNPQKHRISDLWYLRIKNRGNVDILGQLREVAGEVRSLLAGVSSDCPEVQVLLCG